MVNYFSPQVMQIQKEIEEVKKKKHKKKDEKKEYEFIYNKFTVTDYDVLRFLFGREKQYI